MKFDEKAIEFLQKLPKDVRHRVFDKIITSRKESYERLKGHNLYKLRAGDYRIIAELDNEINILLIGHRKNIYDKL